MNTNEELKPAMDMSKLAGDTARNYYTCGDAHAGNPQVLAHRIEHALTTATSDAAARIAELTRERDFLKHALEKLDAQWKEELDNWAKITAGAVELRAENDQLRADLEAAKRERDEANDELTGILRTGTGLLLQESQQREFKLQSALAAARQRIADLTEIADFGMQHLHPDVECCFTNTIAEYRAALTAEPTPDQPAAATQGEKEAK